MSEPPGVIWITGAAGFIGQATARAAINVGAKCYGLDLLSAERQNVLTVDHYLAGALTREALDRLAERSPLPDAIIHLAGGSAVGPSFADPAADFAATVSTSCELFDWVRCKCPATVIVVASSAAVYGTQHTSPIPETGHRAPTSPYGAHKAMMEDLATSYARFFGLNVRVLRLFSVYGAGLRKQILWDLCGRLADSSDVVLGGTGNEMRDFVHVSDTAKALVQIAQCEQAVGVTNIGTGNGLSIADLSGLICDSWRKATGIKPRISFSNVSRAGDPAYLVADVTHAHSLGLVTVTPLAAGIDAYVRWFVADATRTS